MANFYRDNELRWLNEMQKRRGLSGKGLKRLKLLLDEIQEERNSNGDND